MKHMKSVSKKTLPAKAAILPTILAAIGKGGYPDRLYENEGSLEPWDIY